jgi:Chitin recognition protein
MYAMDLECDNNSVLGTGNCPFNGDDCWDCDPLQQFRDMGCATCIANGGHYCEMGNGQPVCSSPQYAAIIPNACKVGEGGTPYVTTCDVDAPLPSALGTCGRGNRGNGICPNIIKCCSDSGWCGTTVDYCGSESRTPVPSPAGGTHFTNIINNNNNNNNSIQTSAAIGSRNSTLLWSIIPIGTVIFFGLTIICKIYVIKRKNPEQEAVV